MRAHPRRIQAPERDNYSFTEEERARAHGPARAAEMLKGLFARHYSCALIRADDHYRPLAFNFATAICIPRKNGKAGEERRQQQMRRVSRVNVFALRRWRYIYILIMLALCIMNRFQGGSFFEAFLMGP